MSDTRSSNIAPLVRGPSREGEDAKRSRHKKTVHFWSCVDVSHWLKKHSMTYYSQYGTNFLEHDITGRALMRMTDSKLEKLGIPDSDHRADLLYHIQQLKLKYEMEELRNLEEQANGS